MRIIPDGFRQAYCSQLSAAPVISGTWEYLRHDYLQKSASQVRSTSMVGLTLLMAQRPRVARGNVEPEVRFEEVEHAQRKHRDRAEAAQKPQLYPGRK